MSATAAVLPTLSSGLSVRRALRRRRREICRRHRVRVRRARRGPGWVAVCRCGRWARWLAHRSHAVESFMDHLHQQAQAASPVGGGAVGRRAW